MPRKNTAVRWAAWEAAGRQRQLAGPLSAITFPTTLLTAHVEIALGADPAADPATWSWLDITQWVRLAPGIQLTVGRRDESSRVEASVARLTLDNTGGRWVRRNPYSPYYGQLSKNTPIRIGVDPGDGVHYRYHGFVNEWPTRWTDRSATDSTVPIVCGGVLRRMQQGQDLGSALYRTMSGVASPGYLPIAYWSMEDGALAGQFASGLSDGRPMSYDGSIALSSDSGLVSSQALPIFSTSATASAAVPAYTAAGRWYVQVAVKISAAPAAETTLLQIRTNSSSRALYRFTVSPGSPTNANLYEISSAGAITATHTVPMDGTVGQPLEADVLGRWVLLTIGSEDDGPDLNTWFYIATENVDLSWGVLGSTAAGASGGKITNIQLMGGSVGAGFGHCAVYTDATFEYTDVLNNVRAFLGWAGEQAHVRMLRLCRETGVGLVCTSARSAKMGPQSAGTLLDNLRACEAADQGVLYEHEHGLGYQSLDDRLNAPVQFPLDFDSRHVSDTPEPADDDQRHTNRFTVTRSGGSGATIQDDAAVATEGVFDGSATLNLYTDSQASHAAGWRVHLGTVDEDRWPAIPIRLHATPDLIPTWTALPYGARMTLANPPAEMAPDTIDAIVEGWSESFTEHEWAASLNTTPASPYRAGIYASSANDQDPNVARYDVDSLVLAADVDTTQTSWQVTSTPLLTTDPAQFSPAIPADIGGERVLITGCTGGSNPQTLAVTRSDNTVVKQHSLGDEITLRLPTYAL